MVDYPQYPGRGMKPGEGINANPPDQNILLDFTAPLGKCTGVYYGLMFQLGKWGFERFKVSESIFVSQINKGYYDLVLGERERLMQQIKNGLASIAQAYADLELILHDLRKYREYLKIFNEIREAEETIKREKDEKKIEEAKNKRMRAIQTLRSIFIDQVDIHTDLPNTPIALRSIVSRWPTIISDFMKLDKEKSPEEIKLDVSYAEKVVLATKNKLFLSWLEMFETTVRQRYERLKELAVARENSVKEYKEMIKPLIARYKMINDMLSSSGGRTAMVKLFFRPEAQAFSIDSMTIWAWKPFAPEEKWKASREYFDKIHAKKAGFTEEEIEILKKKGKIGEDEMIEALPIEPSVDNVVREIMKRINDEYGKKYGVQLTIEDLFEARKRLLSRYKSSPEGLKVTWPFSPYFVFLEIPMDRVVLVLPNGAQLEDLEIGNLKSYVKTQNIIIGHILEIMAKEKALESEIDLLLGELGFDKDNKLKRVKEMLKEEFLFIYGSESEIKEYFTPKEAKIEKKKKSILDYFKKILDYFGIQLTFIRAYGPYEHNVAYRIAKYYFKFSGMIFNQIKSYLASSFQVPGYQIEVRL
ncbi:MAG: hypothetical protein RQ930_00420 [Candidatus Aenigmarchaeota archaeon]|nr:hypothetical protein [Candidatus Aenigmarchaeota archaeon]